MSEWKEETFKNIVHSMQLGTNALGKKENVGVPLLKMGNITIGGFNFESFERLEELPDVKLKPYLLKKGDFLFNTRNTLELVGKSAVWNNHLPTATFNSNVMRIKFKEGVDDFYIGYYFSYHEGWNELKKISTGTTSVAAIYSRDLLKCQLKLPPLPVQRKIARILSTIDGQIEKTEAIIAKYQAVKQGMLQDLFTRGIDVRTGQLRPRYEDAPDLYQESALGMIPKEWAVKSLRDVADHVDYRGKTPTKSESGIFLVTAKNVKEGYLDYDISKEYIPEETFATVMSRGIAEVGDVLITTEAPMGNVAQVDKPYIALAQRVIKYRGKVDVIKNGFLRLVLMSRAFQDALVADSSGSTVTGIKGSRLHKMKIIVPGVSEQMHIQLVAKSQERMIEGEQQALHKLQLLKQGMMQDLLSGKVEV
jgi:type I restriction enzyme, S subunit